MTKVELWNTVINTDEGAEFLCYLKERWMDEYNYEDFNEYIKAVSDRFKVEVVKGSKRPWGFTIKCSDGYLFVGVKATSTSMKLYAKNAKVVT